MEHDWLETVRHYLSKIVTIIHPFSLNAFTTELRLDFISDLIFFYENPFKKVIFNVVNVDIKSPNFDHSLQPITKSSSNIITCKKSKRKKYTHHSLIPFHNNKGRKVTTLN